MSPSELAVALERARRRTEELLERLSDDELTRQVSPVQSPLVWDVAHVAHFEELWLVRQRGGPSVLSDYDDVYDAFAHPRPERERLPLLPPPAARAYMRDVRDAVLGGDGDLALDPVYVAIVVQHELQHRETMAQTLALAGLPGPEPKRPPEVAASGSVLVAGGSFTLGGADPWAYDNERPAHAVDLPPFGIDRALVTNGDYSAFVDDGGYDDRSAWSDDGWAWRLAEGVEAPLYWQFDGGRRSRRCFDRTEPLSPHEPVQHVSFHEAEAYARWAGKRLPNEAEWEKAVKIAGAEIEHARGAVWQWTVSKFGPYPGFRPFPYREYSEPFFGDGYRVLRGSSWCTDPVVARVTFRNWDLPQRRQIFAGVRCAADG